MSKLTSGTLLVLLLAISASDALNKYSKEANVKEADKPFRMMKLNELWSKAVKRLDGQKLKNLMSDLKAQDKEELALKKLKADNQDKDGIKEAQVRRQLSAILQKYGLAEHYKSSEDNNASAKSAKHTDDYVEKQIFRDKKLDKLWRKAQNAGLNDEQMKILKEEFRHHEEKIEQYNQLIDDINTGAATDRAKGQDWENSMNRILNEEDLKRGVGPDAHQAVKDKHFEIKDNYKRLSEQILYSLDGAKSFDDDFEEETVQKLWDLAKKSNFDRDELMSLREELDHYQNRIRKLKHFESQLELDVMAGKDINENLDGDESDKHLKKKVKDLNHKVTKLHNELETRIMQRHIEL